MHLKSLTLRGFKSFASATTLAFEPGVTCVVGPNGSGKSNVVDALSWVMGEQGAKTLRGGKMEDVIFAGTAGRPPLGRAEVVLTIDNRDGALPIEYAEVTITRTLFRSGGSEYAINGRACRLLDVQELLSDSGIGREMHVIVGQGQLDTILQATPEDRRGFIEEAAGVLKHRKRKEKALRKLETCEGNLTRLSDLITEIRRQLKPLGRQAEVARRAAVIQAEVRDARARLLADDLVQATLAAESARADEAALAERRAVVEQRLADARAVELAAEESVRGSVPRLRTAADTWYALAALRERVTATISVARERTRNLGEDGPVPAGRDPEELDRQAAEVAAEEARLAEENARRAEELRSASAALAAAEDAHRAESERLAVLARAAADRREGLARLAGQVGAARSRVEAAAAEIGRLTAAAEAAEQRAAIAQREFTAVETRVAGLDDGELGLDSAHETAEEDLVAVEARLAAVVEAARTTAQERAGAAARVDALRVGLQRPDAGAHLLAEDAPVTGVLGAVAALLQVEPGYEAALAAALGGASDAVAVAGLEAAAAALAHLQAEDRGRAYLLLGGQGPEPGPSRPPLPEGASWAADLIRCPPSLAGAVGRLLQHSVVVDDLAAATALVAARPEATAVTRAGDVLSRDVARGGSAGAPSALELRAAIDEAEQRLAALTHEGERLRFEALQLTDQQRDAAAAVEVALARLHESDAALAAVAEELGQLHSTVRSASEEAARVRSSLVAAEDQRARDLSALAELEHRLELAGDPVDDAPVDPAHRDALAAAERTARAVELEARLALRTSEEQARALAGRADALRRAAAAERAARVAAEARREQRRRAAVVAAAVLDAGTVLLARIETSLVLAAAERTAAEAARSEVEITLGEARGAVRDLGVELEALVDSTHRDELARAEHRMRVAALGERALSELGVAPEALMAEYGPDSPVPVLTSPSEPDGPPPAPVPYVREQQAKRLRRAERALADLGRVNPLALEEFAALEERHGFLATQLEDLRQTRTDLLGLIAEVDARVQAVFAEAYADVERAFARVFARLFPGGEGRLVLTDPGNWLTTGVEVEARPPGKKIKRLSLLSGGERSLVAVAFLVSLFLARPSPFYILDEVEAALDDVNLGRLLEIYEELRESSQLLVITHQKRTMEIADALYGVTMRGGVSTVISQRLRDTASVA